MSRSDKRYPAGDHSVVLPRRPGHYGRSRGNGLLRMVGGLNLLIRLVCGLVAIVLLVDIVLTLARADFHNDIAGFIHDIAVWASFGMRELFTPPVTVGRVALGESLAVLLWLFIGSAVTGIIARIFVPGLRRR